MREAQVVLSGAGFHGPEHIVAHVERDLQGYLAAIEEGLPVIEPKGQLVAALLLGEITHVILLKILSRFDALRARVLALWPARSTRQDEEPGSPTELPQRRRVFARYLYQRGRLHG